MPTSRLNRPTRFQRPTSIRRCRCCSCQRTFAPGAPRRIWPWHRASRLRFSIARGGLRAHLWFVFGEKDIDDLSLEITVDGAAEPQVRMPFRSFFGALLGFEDYHINSAGLVNFPNFTVTNDPMIQRRRRPDGIWSDRIRKISEARSASFLSFCWASCLRRMLARSWSASIEPRETGRTWRWVRLPPRMMRTRAAKQTSCSATCWPTGTPRRRGRTRFRSTSTE